MGGSITLKWGTLKGWSGVGGDAIAACQKFLDLGSSHSAMHQVMTDAHKEALCDFIDAVDEPILNDWSGEKMTKAEAKKYVMEYGEK